MYGFQSHISMPIVLPDGTFFGTLCAIDPRPARLKGPETIGMFKLFADLIGFHLKASMRLASSEAVLVVIDDVLDFARGRLGGGLTLTRSDKTLQPRIDQVVEELRLSNPDRTITTDCTIDQPVVCDAARISQFLSNLLGNALSHGARHSPVIVRAMT